MNKLALLIVCAAAIAFASANPSCSKEAYWPNDQDEIAELETEFANFKGFCLNSRQKISKVVDENHSASRIFRVMQNFATRVDKFERTNEEKKKQHLSKKYDLVRRFMVKNSAVLPATTVYTDTLKLVIDRELQEAVYHFCDKLKKELGQMLEEEFASYKESLKTEQYARLSDPIYKPQPPEAQSPLTPFHLRCATIQRVTDFERGCETFRGYSQELLATLASREASSSMPIY